MAGWRKSQSHPSMRCVCVCVRPGLFVTKIPFVRCQIPWPFGSRELCRNAHIVCADLKEDNEDFHRKRTENCRE